MIRYKAVRVTGMGERVSLNVSGHAQIIYERNKWTDGIPEHLERNLGICVFDTLQSALDHCGYTDYPIEVWKCEVDDPIHGYVFHDMDLLEQGIYVPTPQYHFPMGTEQYKRIKLIEVVTGTGEA